VQTVYFVLDTCSVVVCVALVQQSTGVGKTCLHQPRHIHELVNDVHKLAVQHKDSVQIRKNRRARFCVKRTLRARFLSVMYYFLKVAVVFKHTILHVVVVVVTQNALQVLQDRHQRLERLHQPPFQGGHVVRGPRTNMFLYHGLCQK